MTEYLQGDHKFLINDLNADILGFGRVIDRFSILKCEKLYQEYQNKKLSYLDTSLRKTGHTLQPFPLKADPPQ